MKNQKTAASKSPAKRGFASMSEAKVKDIARKGGLARVAQEGPEGMAELGRHGGQARSEQLGHAGYVKLGRMGGQARAAQAGQSGMAEMGRRGGQSRSGNHHQDQGAYFEDDNEAED